MSLIKSLSLGCVLASLFLSSFQSKATDGNLQITYDTNINRVILSWSGSGVLLQVRQGGRVLEVPVPYGQNYYVVPSGAKNATFRFEPTPETSTVYRGKKSPTANGVFSLNVVGYVNHSLPPGLSLIENPLYNYSDLLAYLWPDAPDGAQILKYRPGIGYEVSTYDGLSRSWSNPNLELAVGEAFYFRNTSDQTITQTFVGEVMQGWMTNSLPAGYSMKGSLVPQAGSINSVHAIPGEIGDEIQTWSNDLQGGGTANISRFDGKQWTPDLYLGVGQGFWIYKQRKQDWIRYLQVN